MRDMDYGGEDPDDDLDLTPEEDRAQANVDVTITAKDGRVSVAFAVAAEDIDILETFIKRDMLDKIAAAVSDKMGQRK